MAKIPVGAAIVHAYRFGFGRFAAILGVMWASWLLMMLAVFLSRGSMATLQQAAATRDFSLMQGQWAPLIVFFATAAILILVQMAGLTRLALGLPMPSRFFYFSLGKPVWRLLGAALLAILAMMAVAICCALVFFAIGFAARTVTAAHPSPIATLVTGLLIVLALLVVYGGFLFMMVRFLFLLAPVTIAEERISIFRGWSLSHRNFWRIVLVMLAILLPIAAVEIAGMLLLAGPMPLFPHGASPEQLVAFRAARAAWQAAMTARMQSLWYVLYPAMGLLSALFYGMSSAAQAFAYRALTSEPVASD